MKGYIEISSEKLLEAIKRYEERVEECRLNLKANSRLIQNSKTGKRVCFFWKQSVSDKYAIEIINDEIYIKPNEALIIGIEYPELKRAAKQISFWYESKDMTDIKNSAKLSDSILCDCELASFVFKWSAK